MHPLEAAASEFARWAHGAIDQRRDYTNEPYIVHPEEVASIVRSVPHTPEMLAASWLHDTPEDVSELVTLEDIFNRFGPVVGTYVDWLTDKPHPPNTPRRERKARDRARLQGAPAEVQTIKVADLLSNTLRIAQHNPDFARVYVPEKAHMLCVLTKADATLIGKAFTTLLGAADQLGIDIFGRSSSSR